MKNSPIRKLPIILAYGISFSCNWWSLLHALTMCLPPSSQIITRLQADPEELPRLGVSVWVWVWVWVWMWVWVGGWMRGGECVCVLIVRSVTLGIVVDVQNFGLDTKQLATLIGDCPLPLYDLATKACNMDPDRRHVKTLAFVKYEIQVIAAERVKICLNLTFCCGHNLLLIFFTLGPWAISMVFGPNWQIFHLPNMNQRRLEGSWGHVQKYQLKL